MHFCGAVRNHVVFRSPLKVTSKIAHRQLRSSSRHPAISSISPQMLLVYGQSQKPYQGLLTVFGLGSSAGTTYVTSLLEKSTGVERRGTLRLDFSSDLPHREYGLQHVSLPSGIMVRFRQLVPEDVVPVPVSSVCTLILETWCVPNKWMPCFESHYQADAFRWNVSADGKIMSILSALLCQYHIYSMVSRSRVEASAVLVVRDKSIGSIARPSCIAITRNFEPEEQLGLGLAVQEAMDHFPRIAPDTAYYAAPPLVVLSLRTRRSRITVFSLVLDQLKLPRVDVKVSRM
jgi:hypothetical protein